MWRGGGGGPDGRLPGTETIFGGAVELSVASDSSPIRLAATTCQLEYEVDNRKKKSDCKSSEVDSARRGPLDVVITLCTKIDADCDKFRR